jgi:hypothetical protein
MLWGDANMSSDQINTDHFVNLPDLNDNEFIEFRINFARSILLSLLSQKKLTLAQFECCMEKVIRRNTVPPIS